MEFMSKYCNKPRGKRVKVLKFGAELFWISEVEIVNPRVNCPRLYCSRAIGVMHF